MLHLNAAEAECAWLNVCVHGMQFADIFVKSAYDNVLLSVNGISA
jgi:hypothetical protein